MRTVSATDTIPPINTTTTTASTFLHKSVTANPPLDVYNHRPESGDNKSSIASSSTSSNASSSTPSSDFHPSPVSLQKPTDITAVATTPEHPDSTLVHHDETTPLPLELYATPEAPQRPHLQQRRHHALITPPPKFVLPPSDGTGHAEPVIHAVPHRHAQDAESPDTLSDNKENRVKPLMALFQHLDATTPNPIKPPPALSDKRQTPGRTARSSKRVLADASSPFRNDDTDMSAASDHHHDTEDVANTSMNFEDLVAKFESAALMSPSPLLSSASRAASHYDVDVTPPRPQNLEFQEDMLSPCSPQLASTLPALPSGIEWQPSSFPSTTERADRVANALERLCDRIDDYATNPDGEGNAPREAVIPLMVESMQQHRHDRKVADRALNTLRKLTVSDTCRARIGECGGIESVVAIMKCHSSVRIQTQACLALANLTYLNDLNKEIVMRCRGFQAVIAALSQHWSDVHVQAWGCLALRNFTNYSVKPVQDTSVSLEAVSVLLYAVERYPRSEMVQNHSLTALVNIARVSQLGRERIISEGGINSLVVCMRNNAHSAKLSEVALSLARFIVEDKKSQKAVGYSNGTEAVTTIMEKHRGNVGIAVKGCTIFRYLAFERMNREKMGNCDGIRAIMTAITDHEDVDVETLSGFLRTLGNVTYGSSFNKTQAGRLDGVSHTLKILSDEKYKDMAVIMEDACRVLRNLVDNVMYNQRLLVRNKGIAIVLDAIRSHGTHSAGVAEHGIAIFVNMSTNRSFAHQLNEGSGDIAHVARTMRNTHQGKEEVAAQATTLLESIGLSHSGRLMRQGSGMHDLRLYSSKDRNLRASASHHRGSKSDEQQSRLQRLRSVPLPLTKHRPDLAGRRV